MDEGLDSEGVAAPKMAKAPTVMMEPIVLCGRGHGMRVSLFWLSSLNEEVAMTTRVANRAPKAMANTRSNS